MKFMLNADNKNSLTEGRFGVVNLVVLLLCVFLLIFYIVQVNELVSRQYRIDILKNRLGSLMEKQHKTQAEKFGYDGIPQIVQFARRSGMVEGINSIYIFEKSSVAGPVLVP